MIKQFSISILASAFTLFVSGYLLYGFVFAEFMAANAMPGIAKPTPDWGMLISGEIIFGAFLVLVISRWRGIQGFWSGFRAGAAIGCLFGLGLNLAITAQMNLAQDPLISVLLDSALITVRLALACGVGAYFLLCFRR